MGKKTELDVDVDGRGDEHDVEDHSIDSVFKEKAGERLCVWSRFSVTSVWTLWLDVRTSSQPSSGVAPLGKTRET